MSVNFVPSNSNSYYNTISDSDVHKIARIKTNEEMNPDKFNRNSKILFGASFLPFLLMDSLKGTKGLLKFSTFVLTLLGFNATDRMIENNSEGYRNFEKNNPLSSLLLKFTGLLFTSSLIDRGLESGGVYDKVANSIETKWSNFKTKDFYKKIKASIENKPKLNNALNSVKNGFRNVLQSSTTQRILSFSPFLIIPALIFRTEHFKNKYKEKYQQNCEQIRNMGI